MDPSGPAQPSWRNAYETSGVPEDTNQAERNLAQKKHEYQQYSEPVTEDRKPGKQQSGSTASAQFSSLGYGESKASVVGEEKLGRSEEDMGRHRELDGEQMRAPGEGEVADVVERKPGAGPGEPDFASGLERKKQEQAAAREEMKQAREHGMVSDEAGLGRGTEGLRDV